MNLTPLQKNLLNSLKDNPIWISLIKELRSAMPPVRYRPQDGDRNYQNWIYESGKVAEAEAILSLLYGGQVDVKQQPDEVK